MTKKLSERQYLIASIILKLSIIGLILILTTIFLVFIFSHDGSFRDRCEKLGGTYYSTPITYNCYKIIDNELVYYSIEEVNGKYYLKELK